MEENYQTHALDAHTPKTAPVQNPHRRRPVIRAILGMVALSVLAVVAYSIYVAVHEPDPQETVVLGQTKLASASPAALRILVRNRVSGKPIQGAEVALSLRGATNTIKLGTFRTDASGSLGDSLTIPDIAPGEYELVLETRSSVGSDRVVKKVEIQHPARLLLSSDKPLYQPGQTIHLRSLALNGRTQKPFAGQPVTFELKDPKGNKVFKETRKSSEFGIASADFVLASEVNLGRYEFRVAAGNVAAERTLEVKPYVLPKFKIQVATDQPYYLPGQTVSGSVQVGYFFGQPVTAATVKLTASAFEAQPIVVTTLQGQTDSAGKYAFQFPLPAMFVGLPQMNEQAFLDLKAEVRDTAQHSEETTLSLSVARNDLEITAIPEMGTLVPGVENLLYVTTAYPDGHPAPCKVFIDGTAWQSDAQGVSEIKLSPTDVERSFDIIAADSAGRRAKLAWSPDKSRPAPAFLLRTDKAVYEAGQSARVTVLSPEKQNTVFIDVVKDGQTVLTRSVALENHTASYALALPASLVGTLKLSAYVITENGEDRGCSRLIYVNPASGLRVAANLAKASYRPGEVAKLDFAVTDADGRPVPAALGIAAVDESVFALSENRPGLLQQFLDVEADLLKPRYQIKSFECPGQFLTGSMENQALAKVYFASFDQQPTGLMLDDIIRSGGVTPNLIERIRSMRETPGYEFYRKDPQFAEVIRLLENDQGLYNLREATGPAKLHSAENHRKLYFKSLRLSLALGVVTSLFLAPVFLLLRYLLRGPNLGQLAGAEKQTARFVQLATSSYNLTAVLTLLPVISYPIGILLLCQSMGEHALWVLLALENIAVLLTLGPQYLRLRRAEAENIGLEVTILRVFVGAFLTQFVVSRAGVAWMMSHPMYDNEGFVAFWVLGSVVAPLVILAGLDSCIKRREIASGVEMRARCLRLFEVLAAICIIVFMGAALLPALSRAKERGSRTSLWNDFRQLDLGYRMAEADTRPDTASPAAPRLRRDFPETLLWRPELITDDHGRAIIEIPLADSITTWRASVDGVSAAGKLGSVQVPIPVFQDFFVDLDLPVSMSLGDQVSVPVACYNYLKEAQVIRLTVASADWFESPAQNMSVHLGAGEVKSLNFPLKGLRVGVHSLRVTAQGAKVADAIEREVRVLPTGQRIEHSQNGVLTQNWTDTFGVSPEAVPDSQSLWVKFYPSRFAEVVEGLDAIFQAPYGCFEQTSSTTYPNVLVLDYMKRMGRLTPEIELTARKYINAGYQRLLTFEVAGGGFEWYGRTPANICLTAYGILEFTDMARVHSVDEQVTARARRWLFSQQNTDGSWNEIHRGWTWAGRGSITAFVTWALAESGDQSSNLERALAFLRSHPQELSNPYAKALAANAFLAHDRNDASGRELAGQLKVSAVSGSGQTAHWTSDGYSMTYSHGAGMDVETTALAAMALIKAGIAPESVKQALTWISSEKSSRGTWGSTQATILAMRALLAGSSASFGQEFDSTITVLLDGKSIETFLVNKDNSDVMKQIELTRYLHSGDNRVELRQAPAGELPFQLTGVSWLPADRSTLSTPSAAVALLQIDVQYDHTSLPVNELLKSSVTISNNTGQVINMAIVDLGIPPGFEVDSTAFAVMQWADRLDKFEVAGNQVILYLRELSNTTPLQFTFALRAKYPLRVQTPPSAVYEYYQPKNRAQSKPVILEALAR